MTETMRVPGPHEHGRFSREAWGHLLSLSHAGVLNQIELDRVIERALAYCEGPIALDDLRALLEGGASEGTPSPDTTKVH